MNMIGLNYKETDIERISLSEENSFKIYTITISEKNLSSGIKKLNYTYWLHKDNSLSRILINQEGIMSQWGNSDVIKTVYDISFK